MSRSIRAAAFDLVVRVLAERIAGLQASEDLRAMVARADRGLWRVALPRARSERIVPAFAAALRDLDLFPLLDTRLRAFLAIEHAANLEHNRKLRQQLKRLVSTLNAIGIEPVLLKGAIRLVDALYPDPGWRLMADLDVLVAPDPVTPAVRALEKDGYAAVRVGENDRKDVKILRQNFAPVEIHKALFWTERQQRLLPAAEVIDHSQPVMIDGARARLPSIEHQFVHLVGHAQVGHFGYTYGRIALRDRLEAAMLLRRVEAPVDLDQVTKRFAAAGYRRPLLTFLLSLREGNLSDPPFHGRIDPLSRLQHTRVEVQRRSDVAARLGLWIGWLIVLLRLQTVRRRGGERRLLHTMKSAILSPQERRRILRTLLDGAPRPW